MTNHSNTAVDTTLTAGIGTGDTAIVVAAATGWPAAPFYAVLTPGDIATEEVILVTAAVGTAWTATRGADGTTAKTHALGAMVRHSVVAADLTGAVSSVNGDTGAVVLDAADVGADPSGTASAAIATHVGLPDPHIQYALESALGSLAALSAVTASLISDASANGRSLLTAADYAAMRALLFGVATAITGGGTLALGGFTLTIPATGTAALLGQSNLFTARQDIRASGAALAAGLYVPWVSGDALTLLYVGTTGAGNDQVAIQGRSNSNVGVNGASVSNTGVNAVSTSGFGLTASTTSGGAAATFNAGAGGFGIDVTTTDATIPGIRLRKSSALTNTVAKGALIGHFSSGTPAAGFGVDLGFQLKSSTTNNIDAASITALWTDATHATRTSALAFSTVNAAGALTEQARLTGAGALLVRSTDPANAAGLYVPWITGDALPTARIGSTSASNAQNGLRVQSGTGIALVLDNNAASTSAIMDVTNSGSGIGIDSKTAGGTSIRGRNTTAATNTVLDLMQLQARSSGTPAAGFGAQLGFALQSTTTVDRTAAQLITTWVDPTQVSRTARLTLNIWDTASREGLRIEASGSAPMIGFLGANAVVRQILSAAASDPGTTQTLANDLRTALINLGLAA